MDASGPDRGDLDPAGVLDQLGVGPGAVIADVGCGEGGFTLPAAERAAPGTVYAVDPDGLYLDEIEARAIERGLENVVTISGRVDEFGALLPEPVDLVLVVGGFSAVDAPTAFARAVSRALRPDGRFVVIDCGGRSAGSGPGSVRSAVAPADLTSVRELSLPGGRYGLVFKRRHDA